MQMTIMSDARKAVERKLRRQRSYANYKSQVLEDREEIANWIVTALVRRHKAYRRRKKSYISLLAWLRMRDSLQSTYSSVFGIDVRLNWARRQMKLLLDESMRLFEDVHSLNYEVAQLLENLLSAQHDDECWIVRVRLDKVAEYRDYRNRKHEEFYTIRFSFDRRPEE